MKKSLSLVSALIAIASMTADAHAQTLSPTTKPVVTAVSTTSTALSQNGVVPDYLNYPDWIDED
jgi:hypothetical protein